MQDNYLLLLSEKIRILTFIRNLGKLKEQKAFLARGCLLDPKPRVTLPWPIQ